ncbi:MAG: hypothetical protein ACJAYJ_002527 [Saprospiraceae bacterium]|jgi:hypothetical protein
MQFVLNFAMRFTKAEIVIGYLSKSMQEISDYAVAV